MRAVSIFRNLVLAILCIAYAASSCTKDPDSKPNLAGNEVVAANIAK